ncbi:hypothetical protein [Streptomyces sp. NPDC059176]|uniref:hypothetical protein n=1 Tax=Streptomyces sp. NPDC059176 TaxID=3346758 RepID=UPI0036C1F5B4
MSAESRSERNVRATQLAGAAVAHFLANDEESLNDCLRQIPDPPGALVGMLRFAALAVTAAAEDSEAGHIEVAQQLVLRVADLEA